LIEANTVQRRPAAEFVELVQINGFPSCFGGADAVDKPELLSKRSQPQIGVVMSKQQTMLSAAREHSVRFGNSFRDEIINETPNIRFPSGEDQGWFGDQFQCGVSARNEALAAASSYPDVPLICPAK
jgi:hypothetical protein